MPALAFAPAPSGFVSAVHLARGARAAEARLFAEIDALLPEGRVSAAALARPVRVVLPSRSLRLHVSTALMAHRGAALVGLGVHTLHGLALEILDRSGTAPPGSAALFDVLVRRFSREEVELYAVLEHLVDGYAAVTGTVRDLLDAGFEPDLLDGVIDALEGAGPSAGTPTEIARARALVRVAARVGAAMESHDIGRAGALYQRAAQVLRRDPDAALPSRAILLYGFAEATGVASDLLETLAGVLPTTAIIDQPPDPALPARPDLGVTHTRRLVERLGQRWDPEGAAARVSTPPRTALALFRASGAQEEAREVAHRVRTLLDSGVAPEGVGIVARDLRGWRVPLRTHLRRLGVPFSGVGALGPAGGMGRRIHAMLDLLRKRLDVPVDRWLDALGPRGRIGRRPAESRRWRPVMLFDLRLALRALGAAHLSDVAALDAGAALAGRARYPLPVRRGLWEGEGGGDPTEGGENDTEAEAAEDERGRGAHARRRSLDGVLLQTTVSAAQLLAVRFAEWPELSTLPEHLAHLRKLLREDLGWDQQYLGMPPVFGALGGLEREFPRTFSLRFDEFALLVSRALFDIGAEPLGGAGAGVAVLAVPEARARTFQHLFVLGLNRDVFPRTIQEDPLLPDSVRRAIRPLVPDLPVKQEGFDEERYLFAELVSSSPSVTLSWQAVDDDGRARPPSPLVERLRWMGDGSEPALVTPLYAVGGVENPVPAGRVLPVEDHAVLAALHGDRESWGAVLPLSAPLASARLRVLDELDPDRSTREGRARSAGLGPYLGQVGATLGPADPRRAGLYITTVERMSGCPWQVFLERLLRLEAPPDPLQALPGLDPFMLGNVVHRVLERIVVEALGAGSAETLEEVALRPPVSVAWPEDARLDGMLAEEAAGVLQEAGLGLPGFSRALVQLARPYLESARARDWNGESVPVLGIEVEGAVSVTDSAGQPREIRFKVDRVDRDPSGRLRLTDYKTGRPIDKAKGADTQRRKFLGKVSGGQQLQAVAYALAGGDQPVEGRYLFLKPDLDDSGRDFAVRSEDEDFTSAFFDASRAVLNAWDSGSFFPRLVDPDDTREPAACKRCTVAQACLRGDSGARGRLAGWARGAQDRIDQGLPLSAEDAVAFQLWAIAAPVPDPAKKDKEEAS